MSGIQTARGQEKFVKPLSGYTDVESIDDLQYVTAQNVGGRKRAMDMVQYGLYELSNSNAVGAGSTSRIIKKTSHGARKNDVVQFDSGSNAGISIQILSCPDANTIILAATPEQDTAIGDLFSIKRYVTPQYSSTGELVVVATPGPTQFVRDSVDTEVTEDTVTPANNRALPVKEIDPISEFLYFDYVADGPVSNAGYTELIASTTAAIRSMTWFESSGFPMVVAIGAAASEVDLFVVPPGGFNGRIPMNIPAGSRISIKELVSDAISANTFIVANFYK